MAGAAPPASAFEALQILGNPYNAETYHRLVGALGMPASLTFSPREGDEIVRSLLLRTFTGQRLPDVAFLNGDVIRTFAERGMLTALDTMLEPGMPPFRVGRTVYGVSFGLSVPVVAFNAGCLRRAGIEELPRDWPGILSLAQRLRTSDMLGGFIEHDNGGAFTFLYLLESYGGRPMSEDETRIAFDSPAGLQALEVLRGFGTCGQAAADMSRRQARRAFASGRIGVLVTMSSVIPSLSKAVEVRSTPLPLMNAHARVPAAGPVAVMLTKERRREAWDVIRFATGAEGQKILTQTSGYVPLGESPPRVTPWYTFPGRSSLKISELIRSEMQQVATLQKTPEAAMASMVRSIPRLLARR